MTNEEFIALKATMPWREQTFQTPHGGLIQIIDRNNQEVSLFAMARFVVMMSHKLMQPAAQSQPQPQPQPEAAA